MGQLMDVCRVEVLVEEGVNPFVGSDASSQCVEAAQQYREQLPADDTYADHVSWFGPTDTGCWRLPKGPQDQVVDIAVPGGGSAEVDRPLGFDPTLALLERCDARKPFAPEKTAALRDHCLTSAEEVPQLHYDRGAAKFCVNTPGPNSRQSPSGRVSLLADDGRLHAQKAWFRRPYKLVAELTDYLAPDKYSVDQVTPKMRSLWHERPRLREDIQLSDDDGGVGFPLNEVDNLRCRGKTTGCLISHEVLKGYYWAENARSCFDGMSSHSSVAASCGVDESRLQIGFSMQKYGSDPDAVCENDENLNVGGLPYLYFSFTSKSQNDVHFSQHGAIPDWLAGTAINKIADLLGHGPHAECDEDGQHCVRPSCLHGRAVKGADLLMTCPDLHLEEEGPMYDVD